MFVISWTLSHLVYSILSEFIWCKKQIKTKFLKQGNDSSYVNSEWMMHAIRMHQLCLLIQGTTQMGISRVFSTFLNRPCMTVDFVDNWFNANYVSITRSVTGNVEESILTCRNIKSSSICCQSDAVPMHFSMYP